MVDAERGSAVVECISFDFDAVGAGGEGEVGEGGGNHMFSRRSLKINE